MYIEELLHRNIDSCLKMPVCTIYFIISLISSSLSLIIISTFSIAINAARN